jgi:hypothetical protein
MSMLLIVTNPVYRLDHLLARGPALGLWRRENS